MSSINHLNSKRHARFSAILLAGVMASSVGFISGCSQPEQNETMDATDNADIFDLKVGTCFDNEGEANEEVVSTIPIRNCNQPHDNEVFYVFKLPDAPSYQASEDSINAELDKCADAFNDYVGVDYQESLYELSEFTPTPESWADGDREIVCFLYDPSGDKISESVKGSGFVALWVSPYSSFISTHCFPPLK